MSNEERKSILDRDRPKRALMIVAHPDDETLWAGGTIIARPQWSWHIIALCRRSDPDRSPRFMRALKEMGASGAIGDLDDGPGQCPLPDTDVERAVTFLLPDGPWDVVMTHGPSGEYTRHRRHEETCRAVLSLWHKSAIACGSLLFFAFEDGRRAHLPRSIPTAPIQEILTEEVWRRKHALITECYGFALESWEARTSPRTEAFWHFDDPADARMWVDEYGVTQ